MSRKYFEYKGKDTAWNGISNYIALHGFKASRTEYVNDTIKDFLTNNNLPYEKRNDTIGWDKNARTIQANWNLFVQYVKSKQQP